MLGRANDISQVRPELGHATNAAAFIGRRAMSRGLFLDRRVFLISYDPLADPAERTRLGVASTFLGSRVSPGDKIKIYVQAAQHFALEQRRVAARG